MFRHCLSEFASLLSLQFGHTLHWREQDFIGKSQQNHVLIMNFCEVYGVRC